MTTPRDLPCWRSLLFVPVTNRRFVDRAHERNADAVILDLEDSIPESEKEAARTATAAAAARLAGHRVPVLVRINSGLQGRDDLEWVVSPDVKVIDVPKVAGPDGLKRLEADLSDLEQRRGLPVGGIGLKLIIESAEGLMKLDAIAEFARDCSRVVAMTLGNEDIATELGVSPTPMNLLPHYQRLVIAACFAGVVPLGYADTVSDFSDLQRFRKAIRRARIIGLRGSSCVHPTQIPILNEEFAPSAAEIEFATRVLETARMLPAERRGAFVVDGQMIDLPVVTRCEQLLRKAGCLPDWRESGAHLS